MRKGVTGVAGGENYRLDKAQNSGGKKNNYSKISFALSASPLAILLIVFLGCLVISGGQTSDNDRGAVWWLMVAIIPVFVPVALIADTLAVVFGIIGLKKKKTAFAWGGIIIVALEALLVMLFIILSTYALF